VLAQQYAVEEKLMLTASSEEVGEGDFQICYLALLLLPGLILDWGFLWFDSMKYHEISFQDHMLLYGW